jgi:hypothetical protein
MRAYSPNTYIYITKISFTASQPHLWSLQTSASEAPETSFQITFGGSTSPTLETSLYVVVPVGAKYKVSRISENGIIQWTYEFPMDVNNSQKEVFIEYVLSTTTAVPNTLVISNA